MISRSWPFLAILVATLASVALRPETAYAAVDASKTFPVTTVETAPALALDFIAEPWPRAVPVERFETLTTRTPATRFPTTARLLFDKDNLYVGIHCAQKGAPLTATQTTNNIGFGLDDFVGIGLDTTGNGQSYFFETTPRGVRYQQSAESSKFNPQWTALADPDGDGWNALLVIPLNVLRTQSSPVQRWRFNLIRHIAADNENQTWAYNPLMSDANGAFPQLSDARYWPYLDGVHVAGRTNKPRPRAELYALASAGRDRNVYQRATGVFAPEGTRHVGIDINVPLTGTIAFVGAVAPDFSNVEIDQQTISPQEFRRGLAEYRPFFAQGANFFRAVSVAGINQAPNEIFYSPGIGPFDRGAKIEGTAGLQQFGLLNVAGAGFNDTVLAYKHALPDRTFAYSIDAVSAHHRDGNATAYGAAASDVSYDATVTGRNLHNGFVYTFDYGAERGSVAGTSPRLAYKSENFIDVHKQNYEVYLEYRDVGPKWNPIDGFTNVADIRGPEAFFDLNGNPGAKSPLKRIDFFVSADRLLDRSGAAHQADFFFQVDALFKNLVHVQAGPSFSALRFYDGGASLVGFDGGYRGGVTVPFNQHNVNLGYKEGTPTPYNASTSWGPFTTFASDGTIRNTYLRQYSLSTSRPIGKRLTVGAEFDGILEEFATANPRVTTHDGQELRRISIGQALGNESNFAVSLRSISGRGGFGSPGVNLAANYHRRFANNSEVFVNYGTPAATATVQRLIVKYVLRLGSAAGT